MRKKSGYEKTRYPQLKVQKTKRKPLFVTILIHARESAQQERDHELFTKNALYFLMTVSKQKKNTKLDQHRNKTARGITTT